MSYNKALIEIIIFLVLASFSLPIVSGDVATLGWNYDNVAVVPFNNTTNVQMINETVYIDLYEEKAVVDCNFTFKNWGEREQMIVGFPIESIYEPLNDFEVYVDSQPVGTRLIDNYTEFDEMCDWNYRADAWNIWNMTFEKTETKFVRVRYWSRVFSQNNAFIFHPKIWVMDSDGSDKMLLNTIETWDSSAVWSPDGSKIAFVAGTERGLYRDSNYGPHDGGDIWIMNRDGSGKKQLTTKETYDYSPQWSPDGSKILFVSEPSGNEEIYEACKSIWVMNSDGSDKKQLTAFETNDILPSWSPDGSKIAYVSSRYTVKTMSDLYRETYVFRPEFKEQLNRSIWVMNSNGSDKTQLTTAIESCGRPVWSPDGSKIAFISGSGHYPSDLLVMNSDGSNLKKLTAIKNTEQIMSRFQVISIFKRYFLSPTWSPDGTKILFVSNESIYVINSNGSNKMQLTTNETCAKSPAWNPDGSKIAYTSGRYGDESSIWGIASNGQLWMMDRDGTNKRQLIANEVEKSRYSYSDLSPVWSPDGSRILFESGHGCICVANTDGTEIKQLTEDVTCYISSCTWSPDGTKMVFVSDRWDSQNIWIMNSDGSNKKKLTAGYQPEWSPNGNKIVFTTGRSENRSICIMDSDGNDKKELATGYEPVWGPDGNRIAFTSGRYENRSIWIMNVNGSDKHELTTGYEPEWSPDRNKIAFTAGRYDKSSIWVINSDGSNEKQLAANMTLGGMIGDTCFHPVWSPDGSKIAFESVFNFTYYYVWVMNSDGSNKKQITSLNKSDRYSVWLSTRNPVWSPDGSKIAFTSEENGYYPPYTIWVANSDGSNPTRLTTNEIGEWYDLSLSWSPDGSKIAFVASPSDAKYHRFEYILTTGATWKDTIGEAEIIIRLHDINDKDVTWISPQGYVFKDNIVSWHFISLEPTENIELGFLTLHPIPAKPYTETEEIPGFEVICMIIGLLTATYLKRVLI